MKNIWEGLFNQNPVFVLALGLVPAVAIATTALAGWIMGLITIVVLFGATVIDVFITPKVPGNAGPAIRMLLLVVLTVLIYAFLVAFNPAVVASLGIFLPLVLVNSMLLKPVDQGTSAQEAILTSIGRGLGFLLALIVIGVLREFLAFGSLFGKQVLQSSLPPMALANGAPGGLIIVGLLMAFFNKLTKRGGKLHD